MHGRLGLTGEAHEFLSLNTRRGASSFFAKPLRPFLEAPI
jgi:hypothetical protein